MKILRLVSYYYPETVASSHLRSDLNKECAKRGITYTVITPVPSRGISEEVRKEYANKLLEVTENGTVTIKRFPIMKEDKNPIKRAIRYILCNIKTYKAAIKEKDVDLVYAPSTPPTQGLMAGMVAKKLSKKYGHKVPFLYNLQDIFPDSLVNVKMTKKGSLIWKIGRKIEDKTYKGADRIITISEDLKQNIVNKKVPPEKVVIIPNWVNVENVYPIERQDNKLFDKYGLDRNKFYVCYSGNVGTSQNLDLLIKAAKVCAEKLPDVCFVIIGEGVAKPKLEEAVKAENLENVKLFPFQPYEDIAYVFSLGDVGLVISKPGIGASSVPSKACSILAAGRPILASFDLNTNLTNFIERVGCGLSAKAGSVDELVKCIEKFMSEDISHYGEKGRNYVITELNREKCINSYIDTFTSTASIKE